MAESYKTPPSLTFVHVSARCDFKTRFSRFLNSDMKRTKFFALFWAVLFSQTFIAETLNCSEPAPVANAYRFWEGGAAGSYVMYSCLFSYVHTSGDLVRVCNSSDGTYTGEPPVCTLECGVPAEVVGASRVYSSTTEGSRATYTCWDTFKEFLYTGTRYCTLEEGGWAISPLVCVSVVNLANSSQVTTFQSSTKTDGDNIVYNSTIPTENSTAEISTIETEYTTVNISVLTTENSTSYNFTTTAENSANDNSTLTTETSVLDNSTIVVSNYTVNYSSTTEPTVVTTENSTIDNSTIATENNTIDNSTITTGNNTIDNSTIATGNNTIDNSTITTGNITVDNSTIATANRTIDNSTIATGNNTVDNSTIATGNNTIDNSTIATGNRTIDNSTIATGNNTIDNSTITTGNITVDNSTITTGNITVDNSTITTGNNTIDNSTITTGNNTIDNSTIAKGNNTVDNSTITTGNNTVDNSTITMNGTKNNTDYGTPCPTGDGETYESHNAIEGNTSCAITGEELHPRWIMSFNSTVYDIRNISMELPGIRYKTKHVNITVYARKGQSIYDRDVCWKHGNLGYPLYRAKCSSHGIAIEVSAKYAQPGRLSLRTVKVFGRDIGYDDDIARGKRATVNDQGDGAVLVDDDESTCKTFHAQRHTWKVDLGEVFETKTITISLPESASTDHFSVTISRESTGGRSKSCDRESSGNFQLSNGTRTVAFQCGGNPYGRYVKLAANFDLPTSVKLCEVRAFGRRESEKPLECLESYYGREYKGSLNFTSYGEPCVRWESVEGLGYTSRHFPDYSLQEAANNCRNPKGGRSRPWCYTSSSGTRQYCPLLSCKNTCSIGKSGDKYAGKIGKTKSGHQCQRWDTNYPHKHAFKLEASFPDRRDNHAYCRNPFTSQTAPWCFTTNTTVRYETCNIPVCHTRFDVVTASVYRGSGLEHFENNDRCLYWRYPITIARMKTPDPSSICGSNPTAVAVCGAMVGDKLRWKYIQLNCTVPTTTTSTTTTTTTTTTQPTTSTTSTSTTTTTPTTTPSTQSTTPSTTTVTPTTTPSTQSTTPPSTTSPPDNATTTTTSSADGEEDTCLVLPFNTTYLIHGVPTICRCRRRYSHEQVAAIKLWLRDFWDSLLLEKRHLTRYRRRFYSVPDDRPVSITVGSTAVVVIISVVIFLAAEDVVSAVRFLYNAVTKKSLKIELSSDSS